MRKVVLCILFSCIGMYAMGQSGIKSGTNLIPVPKGAMNGISEKFKTNNTPWTHWFNNRAEAVTTGAETYNWFFATIFSDSTVKALYGDGNGGTVLNYVGVCGMGEVFDPKAAIYNIADSINTAGQPVNFTRFQPYSIDSFAFPYLYNWVQEKNPSPKVGDSDSFAHDTLIFQFYTQAGLQALSLSTTPPTAAYSMKYDPKKNLGIGQYSTATYVLGQKDTQSVVNNVIQVATNGAKGISLSPGQLFGFTVSYRPGFKHAFGDTIDEQTSPLPKNLHSHFRYLVGNSSAKDQPSDFEQSVTLTQKTRYNANIGNQAGWNGLYIPGFAWLDYNEILWSLFKVTTPNLAVEGAGDQKGYALGNVYPNPAHGTARIDFSIPRSQNVTIKVYDILGHEVATLADGQFANGSHSIDFNTSELKAGLYLYSFTAGTFSKTLKFTVNE